MLLFRSVVFDIRSVVSFIQSVVHVTFFDQLRIRSVVSFFQSVAYVTFDLQSPQLVQHSCPARMI